MPNPPAATSCVREFPAWSNPPDLEAWICGICKYVEGEAKEAIDWYLGKSRGKRRGSHWIRLAAIFFGGIAGLLPIVAAIWPQQWRLPGVTDGAFSLISSLLIGLVALLLAFDSLCDFSRGWMRYMLTAFEIRASLQEFRLDWAAERAKLPQPLKSDGAAPAALLQLAKEFVLKVEKFVGEETRQWATEFAQNLAQMEKEASARWEQRQKDVEARREAAKPGGIQLTVTNAKAVDGRKFDVLLQSPNGIDPVKASVSGAQTWARSSVAPGMYTIEATATINQKPAAASQVIDVKPAEIREVSLTLMD